jgi:hypothetical protein
MPEYDAFGREIGEDSLAGWRTSEPATARPAPPREEQPAVAVPRPAAPARPSPPSPIRPRRRARPRVVSRLILLLVVVVIGANLIGGAVTKVHDAVDGLTPASPTPSGPPPAGLQPGSLIRAAELRTALRDLQNRNLGRLQTLRLAPVRIDATFLTPRTTIASVQLRHDGSFQRFGESGRGFGGIDAVAFSRLDPAAPQRLVRAAAERLHKPPARIDYLVPSISEGKLIWGAYFKGGAIFLADAKGRITSRIS